MRGEKLKQIEVIAEQTAQAFQDKTNAALMRHINAEIVFDKNVPFTAYILYEIQKGVPETLLEVFELLDENGGNAHCKDCPHFRRSTDGRKKWHTCGLTGDRKHEDSRACEEYYRDKRREAAQLAEELEAIPYKIE